MLKKLKFRFILLAIVSMTVTLIFSFAVVNVSLRVQVSNRTDSLIRTLYENGGRFSAFKHGETEKPKNDDGFMHSETPFETRYYVAYVGESESEDTPIRADFSHIALSNIDSVLVQLDEITDSDRTKGYCDKYRFGKYEYDGGYMIIGIDCSNDLRTVDMLMTITLVTVSVSVVIVLILLLIFSGRIMKPFEENREKQRRFITDAGHELKTPLAIIRSNTEVMEMIDGESKWTDNIKAQTDRMSKLIKGLIELSKMDEQVLSEKEKQRVILSEIVLNSVQSFTVPCEAKGIEMTCEIEPDVAVMGDLEDIVRVTGILLDNAIKYTDDRRKIRVQLYTKSRKAILKVSNTCAGLDKATVNKFFDRFYRGDASRNSKTGGYGIGLSTAQMIIQNHKGKLTVSYSDDEIITFKAEQWVAPTGR